MFDKLLPALENSMKNDNGSMPVVFSGIEQIIEKKDVSTEMSVHNTHEMFYLRSGRLEFITDNKKQIIESGTAVIIKPNVRHRVRVISPTADTVALYFDFSKPVNFSSAQPSLESFMDFAGSDSSDASENYKAQPFIIISGSYKKSISNVMDRIIEEKSNSDAVNHELMIEILTVELLLTMSRALKHEWEESLRVKNGKARELVLIARDYIDDNYERGITVAETASYVVLSQGYFTRAFRDEFGISPMTYLMKKRITKACELLSNPEIKVSGIAAQAGFSSPQRFNVAFRKQMNMTPLEYRKMKTKR